MIIRTTHLFLQIGGGGPFKGSSPSFKRGVGSFWVDMEHGVEIIKGTTSPSVVLASF